MCNEKCIIGDAMVHSKESDTIHHPLLLNSDGAVPFDSLVSMFFF